MKQFLIVAIIAVSIVGLTAEENGNKLPQVAVTEAPAHNGRECTELECWNEGWCRDYVVCDKGVSSAGQCEDDLWWNPTTLVAAHLTGQCDNWENLSEDVQHNYTHTESCIPPCAWWPKDNAACTQNYVFRAPFTGQVKGRETELSCSAGLVWSQDDLTCVHCASRQDENKNSCCGNGNGDQPAQRR